MSDRNPSENKIPIPALLAVSAVHNHLIRKRQRLNASIIIETGEAREIAHFCLLIGFGAGAINPYLAYETISDLHSKKIIKGVTENQAKENFRKAIRKGMLKVFAKMGISTIQSYRGAQIFEAIGLNQELIEEYFFGTPSRIKGMGIKEIAQETIIRHKQAYLDSIDKNQTLDIGGSYFWRRSGEHHQINPLTTNLLLSLIHI